MWYNRWHLGTIDDTTTSCTVSVEEANLDFSETLLVLRTVQGTSIVLRLDVDATLGGVTDFSGKVTVVEVVLGFAATLIVLYATWGVVIVLRLGVNVVVEPMFYFYGTICLLKSTQGGAVDGAFTDILSLNRSSQHSPCTPATLYLSISTVDQYHLT